MTGLTQSQNRKQILLVHKRDIFSHRLVNLLRSQKIQQLPTLPFMLSGCTELRESFVALHASSYLINAAHQDLIKF